MEGGKEREEEKRKMKEIRRERKKNWKERK